jgi:hypothetical protein
MMIKKIVKFINKLKIKRTIFIPKMHQSLEDYWNIFAFIFMMFKSEVYRKVVIYFSRLKGYVNVIIFKR